MKTRNTNITDRVYSEKNNMHTVEINIRAFCTDFTIKVKRKIPMTIQEAQIYVTRTLEWDTAVVTSIKQNGKILKNKKKEFAVTA